MTVSEAEEIGKACKAAGSARDFDQTGRKHLLVNAAEAIEWLLTELEEAERYSRDFEWGQPQD
jgi:hypothetical protein